MSWQTGKKVKPDAGFRHQWWFEHGHCVGVNPEWWFPDERAGDTAEEAKRICRGCPVRVQCLDFALSAKWSVDGVWGGFTAMERRRM